MNPLLHIYDADDLSIDFTASVRRLREWTYRVPVHGGVVGLWNELDDLVKDGQQFSRALFETHGNTGRIFFGGQAVTGHDLRTYFAGQGYERIFPYLWSRIYFNGCNVADDPFGWDFLDAAGSVFLRKGGGSTFASTGAGDRSSSPVISTTSRARRPIRPGHRVESSPATTWIRTAAADGAGPRPSPPGFLLTRRRLRKED